MKVLFLDIDGVLNSIRTCHAYLGYPSPHPTHRDWDKFDDVAVHLIRQLCERTECKIVLSSTWRLYKGWEDLGEFLKLPIIGRTPDAITRRRGYEIDLWLKENQVEKYAIVDDDSDMEPHQFPYFVQTSNKDGMSFDNFEKLLELLK